MTKAWRLVKMEEINNQTSEEEIERDVEVMEFSLTCEEIKELVSKLNQLKETKIAFNFEVDDENEFIIHYEEEEVD